MTLTWDFICCQLSNQVAGKGPKTIFLTMKNLAIAILVFCAFICSGYTFKCLSCENDDRGVDYTMKDCLKDQKVVSCPADFSEPTNYTCFRYHYTTTRGDEKEARGCVEKRACENFKKLCNEGTDEQKRQKGIKECEAASCCVQDGDEVPPCNSARTFKCFFCGNDDRGVNYTTKDCLKDQVEVDCPADNTDYSCYRYHFTTTRGAEKEYRGCYKTQFCKNFTKICNEGPDELKRQKRIEECKATACCVTDSDTPCNGEDDGSTPTMKSSGFTVPIDMFKMMFAVMCSLKLF